MKTLAYFASGIEFDYKELEKIQFDKVILVDKNFSFNSTVKVVNKKVVLLKMDAFEAVDYLKKEKIQLDAFISLNEGLCEGGGDYPLNGFYFLSYLTPILKDNYIHIYDPSYYRFSSYFSLCTKRAFKDHWFVEGGKIKLADLGIPVQSFHNLEKAICIKMVKKNEEETTSEKFSSLKYVKGNIWGHSSEVDKMILPHNRIHTRFIPARTNLIWFKKNEFPFEQLKGLNFPENAILGLTLWYGKDYSTDFEALNEWALKNQVIVKVFYVHGNDKNKLI